MNILERIKNLCNQKGLTIAELERKANVGNGTIRRWGETSPASDKLQRVAECLNVSMDYLATGREDDEEVRAIARNMKKLNSEKRKLLDALIKTMSESADEELNSEDT